MGFETVCPEKDRQTAFYSPLLTLQFGFLINITEADHCYPARQAIYVSNSHAQNHDNLQQAQLFFALDNRVFV